MLKKTVTYTDFDGAQQTEDVYFNLSKAELIETELSAEGGSFQTELQTIIDSKDPKVIIGAFKTLLSKAYGVRSADGKRFIKSPELFEEFTQTAAYDALFTELATDGEAGAAWVRGVIPTDLANAPEVQKTASELARQRSEAALQGHRAKQPSEDQSIQQVPELEASTPELEEDLNSLSIEELRERLAARQ